MFIMFVDKQSFVCLIVFFLTVCSSDLLLINTEKSGLRSVPLESLISISSQTTTLSSNLSPNNNLKTQRCNQYQFECKSDNTCISIDRVQDGIIDCPDASDEKCRNEQFKCQCGFPKCIDRQLVGNGVIDCRDGSDEGEQLPCHQKKHRKKPSGDVMTTKPTKVQLLHKESISTVSASKLSHTPINGSLSSGRVSQSTPNTILVSQTNSDSIGAYRESERSKSSLESMSSVLEMPALQSMPSFVELTATFVPLEQLSTLPALTGLEGVSVINYFNSNPKLKAHDSLIEITGTFVPEMESTLINSTPNTYQINQKTFDPNPSQHIYPNNSITIRGISKTYFKNDYTFRVITGTHVAHNTSYAFVLGNRQINLYENKSPGNGSDHTEHWIFINENTSQQNNSSLVIGLEGGKLSLAVPIHVLSFDKKNNSENNRLLYAMSETDGQVFKGVFVEGISEISVIPNSKPMEQNATLFVISLNSEKPENIIINQKFKEMKPIVKSSTKQIDSKYITSEQNISSIYERKNIDPRLLSQSVVGRKIDDGQQFIVGDKTDPLAKSGSIISDDFSINVKSVEIISSKTTPIVNNDIRKDPVYTHSKVEQIKKTQDINEDVNKVKHKTTIFGFIDFTTIINNTEVVFMPTTKVMQQNSQRLQSKNLKLVLNTRQTIDANFNIKTKEPNHSILITSAKLTDNINTKSDDIRPTKTQSMPKSILISNAFRNRQRNRKEENLQTIDPVFNSKQTNLGSISIDPKIVSFRVSPSLSSSFENQVTPSVESSMIEPSLTTNSQFTLPTGLLSTITGSNALEGTVTEWTTSVIGTYIRGTYAHILQSTSSIYVKPSLTDSSIELESTETGHNTERDKQSDDSEVHPLFENLSLTLESGINDFSKNEDFNPSKHLIESSVLSVAPTRVTITSGFILPGLQSISPSQETPALEDAVLKSKEELERNRKVLNTYYTTNTFYTTVVKDGQTFINSHMETSSNVVLETIGHKDKVLPTRPLTTYYTTYTYFTTFRKGETEFVKSREEIVTNIMSNTIDSDIRELNTISLMDKSVPITASDLTTISMSVPLDSEEINIVLSNNEDSLKPTMTDELKSDMTTLTYLTTHFKEGKPSVKTRKVVISNTLETNQISENLNELPLLESSYRDKALESTVTTPLDESLISSLNIEDLLSGLAVPITHYTTFTYYTTFFREQTSSVISRTQVVSDVKTGTINLGLKSLMPSISKTVENFEISKTKINGFDSTEVDKDFDQLIAAGAENRPIVITPVTRLTTTTYFTTLLIPGRDSTVISSTQVLSDVFLPGPSDVLPVPVPVSADRYLDYRYMSLEPSMTERHEGIVIHSTVDNRLQTTLINDRPETVYTTFTYITTRFANGFPVVDTSYETFSNVITKTITIPQSDITQPSFGDSEDFNSRTLRTTFTYFKTRFTDGTAIIDESKHTISNIVSTPILETQVFQSPAITPSRTKIVVTRTRSLGSGGQPLITGRRPVVVIRKRPVPGVVSNEPQRSPANLRSDTSEESEGIEPHIRIVPKESTSAHIHHFDRFDTPDDDVRRFPKVTPTPVTFYTTYTYFTTELLDGKPVVKSREQLFSTVISGKVLPTRTIPVESVRHKRSAVFDQNDNIDIVNITSSDSQPNKKLEDINGVEPIPIESTDSYTKNDLNEEMIKNNENENKDEMSKEINIENQESNKELKSIIGIISENTEVKGSQTFITEIYGTFINDFYAQFAVTRTISPSNSNDKSVETKENQLSSIESLSNQNDYLNTTTIETSEEIDVSSSVPSLLSSTLSWLSITDLTSSERNIENTIISSFEPQMDSIESESIDPDITSPEQNLSPTTPELSSVLFQTGLLSSNVETTIDQNKTILIINELYGTYIHGIYAHLAKSRTQVLSNPPTSLKTSPETVSTLTPTSTETNHILQPSVLVSSNNSAILSQSSSLSLNESTDQNDIISETIGSSNVRTVTQNGITRTLSTNINNNKTTIYTTNILTTSINGLLAHIGHVNSTIIEPWTSMPGLAFAVTSTQTLDNSITIYTTEFYTTNINGFVAHYSRSTSNIMKPSISSDIISESTQPILNSTFIESPSLEKTKTIRPFIHFPTPVRFLFSSKMTTTLTPESVVDITPTLSPEFSSSDIPMNNILDNKYGRDYYENDEYYDETAEREEHTPRSRPIREKDSQPILEYDYEEVEPSEPVIEASKPVNIIPYRGAARHVNQAQPRNPVRQSLSRQANIQNARRVQHGWGERLGANTPQDSPQEYPNEDSEVYFSEKPIENIPQHNQRQRANPIVTRARRPIIRTAQIVPTQTQTVNNYEQTLPEYRTVDRDNRPEDYQNNRQNTNRNTRRQQPINTNNNRFTVRRRITTTTPAPRTHPVLPNRGNVRLNRRYSGRPRLGATTSTPVREYSEETTQYRNENYNTVTERRRPQQRGRGPKTTVLFLNKPSTTSYSEEYDSPTSEVITTPALPKTPVTVTSIVTTVKTIPIFHGYKTSYATLTTTTLNSSLIQTEQYETSVNPIDGMTKSIFTQIRDTLEPTKLTEVLITTSVLYETKLIQIKIGYNTRTQTKTDVKTLTILTTDVVLVAAPATLFQGQPVLGAVAGLSYSLFTTTNSFITTHTLTTTTVLSLLVRDETILSTLTLTSLTESTITSTQTISIPVTKALPFPVPPPITTLLTLTLTGGGGDITELVTAVTIPNQPVFHTKVERDVKATRSGSSLTQQTVQTSETFDYISASFKTVDTIIPTFDPLFISTIFKGPETEIYEASATLVSHNKEEYNKNKKKVFKNKYETTFKKRKLQQFVGNDNNPYGYPFRAIDYSTVNLRPQTISLQIDQNEPIPDFLGYDSPRYQSQPQSVRQQLPQPVPQPVVPRNPSSRQFQRIRINKPLPPILATPTLTPNTSPPQPPLSSTNEGSALRFQRVIGLDRLPETNAPLSSTPIRLTSQGGFRRVPVFNNRIQSLSILKPPIIEPTITDVYATSILLSPTFGPSIEDQRPNFRRVRPIPAEPQNGPNARRIKPKVKVSSRRPISTPLPTSIRVSSVEVPFLPVSDFVDVPRRGPITRKPILDGEGTPLVISSRVRQTTPTSETVTDPPRRVVRIRRPNDKKRISLPKNPQSLNNELQGRGPVPPRDDEPSKNNALDSDDFSFNPNYGTRNSERSNEIHTPTLPLTYFTTFTYLTTVVRGQHTAHLTRESITSTVSTEALDKTIVDLIQNSDGILSPTKVVDLGTKTKGVTTTIVNLVSRVKIFNEDLYKVIHSTKPLKEAKVTESKVQPIESSSVFSRQQIRPTSVRKESVDSKTVSNNYKIEDLESKPKKQITYFTYYYTLYDKLNTKYSTRAEVVTSEVSPNGLSTLKLDSTINSNGLLSIGSGAETVHLGSRELGGLTTEVNLALNTYLKFDDINNALIEPSPTPLPIQTTSSAIPSLSPSETPSATPSTTSSTTPSTEEQTTSSLVIISSFSTVLTSDQISSISTPSIPLETEIKLQTSHTRKPIKLMSSAVVIRDPLRSKFDAFNARPGVRVRVKPMTDTKKPTLLTSSEINESVTSSEIVVSPTPSLDPSLLSSSEEISKELIPIKKKISLTLRRPFGGISRVSSRRPQRIPIVSTSTVQSTKRLVVVTRTGPLPSVQSTARVKISSRVFKSPVVSLEVTSSSSAEKIEPTTTVNEKGETLRLEVTSVPVIFGLDTSYRTVTLTSTLTSSSTAPLPTVTTLFETTTHTVPFTIGDHTIYTTLEETNSRVVTQTLDSVDPSDAARANRFMKVSNGVTLIVGDNVAANRTPTTPVTLQPTLVTGAAVHMKDGIKHDSKQSSEISSESKSSEMTTLFDTRTLFTTFTYFTTFYTDDTSIISSSEQTVSNIVTIPITQIAPTSANTIAPTVVFETSERIRTETVYSTYTYFATLFNGSTSTITPLEEIKTDYFTLREPITVTRTIVPTTTAQASLMTRTYYTTFTNLVTFFQHNRPVTSTIEETVSSEVVYTVPQSETSVPTVSSNEVRATPALESPVMRTRSTYTTLTHYITLFSGSQTILSSIEEISPTVVTEISGQTQEPTDVLPNIRFTQPSRSLTKQSKDLLSAFVQSISTLFTTHTYFTTLFSGTTSSIISRKQTTSSLVTLYVPQSIAIQSTSMSTQPISSSVLTDLEDESKTEYMIEATPSLESDVKETDTSYDSKWSSIQSIQPSLRIDSSSYEVIDSSIISKVFEDLRSSEGLTEEQLSSVVAEVGASTTVIDGSTVVFFTNFILPSSVADEEMVSTDANNAAKGPAGDLVSSLLNNADMSLLNNLLASRISSVRSGSSASPVYVTPHMPSDPGSEATAIKPGAVYELSDFLDGAQLAGNLGEAIKDIVHILAKAPKGKNGTQEVDQMNPLKDMPPREGVAVSNSQEPVYIPLGAVNKPSVTEADQQNDENIKLMEESNNKRIEIIPSSSVGLDGSTTYVNTLSVPQIKSIPIEASLEINQKLMHSSVENQRPTPLLSSKVIKSTNLPKGAVSRVSSGATTIFFTDTTQNEAKMPSFVDSNSPIESTKYITSVETSIRTLTLTTTKVYYTRDSPLTITSVLTTTIPPRTFVSTIIGSRTILGTSGESQTEAIVPTQVKGNMATTVTTTTVVHNSMTTTVVRTLVVPTATKSVATTETKLPFQRPTRKPGTGPFRAPTRAPDTPKPFKTAAPRPRVPYKPPPPSEPPILLSGGNENPFVPNKRPTIAPTPKTTTRPSILDIDQCKPGCNAANKEICKEMDGKYRCDCRQGFIRKNEDLICQELQNYVVVVRVMKVGESEVTWFSQFSNNSSDEYQNLAKMAKNQVDTAYLATDVKESYVGADVLGIDKVSDGGNGVLVNLTVRLTKRNNLDEDILRETLIKKLEQSDEILPNPQSVSADVEEVIDFDECSSEEHNDCAASARCINEPGTYKCECLNGYPDLDISLPGRVCASEIKGCEFCHGRGDCIRDDSGQSNSCKCHRMYLGRRCEINGLLLAILLPIAAILCIISICCIVYCCRKWRKRTITKGFRNLSSFGPTVIGGTLDRKAMLETSSESSDHLRSHVYDGPGIMPNDPNGSVSHRRRESEPSLDRSMGSMGGPYNSLPPQIVIPRARHSSQQGFYTSETQDSMKYQFVENIPTNTVHERTHLPDIYSFDSSKSRDQIRCTSRISTNRYGKRCDLRKEDDTKSLNSIKSSSVVSRRLSGNNYHKNKTSRHLFEKYDSDWKTTQKQRHYDYQRRPKSESDLLRNTTSESGRSFEEITSRPPTHRLRKDLTLSTAQNERSAEDEWDYESDGNKIFKNDLFSLNSTLTSQQQNCFRNNTDFKLFF